MVLLQILDADTREPLGPNVHGELCARSLATMLGFLNQPEKTAEFRIENGTRGCTGDLVYYNEKGDLFFVDRIKELIKYNARHIAPTALEAIAQTHPAVKESLAFGFPEPSVQELVTMVVVLNEGFVENAEVTKSIEEHVNSRVVDFKKIRGGVMVRESIPHNASGKLLRREMRAWAREQIEKKKNGNQA